jgi:hypothetical protein
MKLVDEQRGLSTGSGAKIPCLLDLASKVRNA